MKKLFLNLVFLSVFVVVVQAQDSVYYYYKNEKIFLRKESEVKFVRFANEPITQLNQLRSQSIKVDTVDNLIYKISGDFKQKSVSNLLFSERQDTNILYISDMLAYEGATVWESDNIIVKIFPSANISEVLKTNGIPYKEYRRLGSNLQTYLVKLDVSKRSSIEYANWLVETQAVEVAQPSFCNTVQSLNPYYPLQWGLKNTGQFNGKLGIDIKAEEAWAMGADGSGVKCAVIDDGVDLTHPDLAGNLLLNLGYDATDGYDQRPGNIYRNTYGGYGGWWNSDPHGTGCIGIIASLDNNIGTKGIAYNAKIIPIRHDYGDRFNNPFGYIEWTVDAIKYAWKDARADIISCSWTLAVPNDAVTDEIDSAVTYGRGGKGCVVVCGAGNKNSGVCFPARLPQCIAAGAISQCGERKRSGNNPRDPSVKPDPAGVSCDGDEDWGSCYGPELDICAPGVNIYTTNIQDGYFSNFDGTSAATPAVAAVAALVLSVDSTLTGKQVRYIIESSAQKIRPDLYNYTPNSKYISNYYGQNFQNGIGNYGLLFNPQVGYGLLNAEAAVRMALCPKPIDLMIGDTPDDAGFEPLKTAESDVLNSPNIWVRWNRFSNFNDITTENQFVKPKQSNSIYVGIKNISCENYTGGANLALYWAKSGTDLNVSGNWHLIQSVPILSMHAGEDYIEDIFAWYPPDVDNYKTFAKPYEFYLMAKIMSSSDTMFNLYSSNFENFVRDNNNVACRRVEIGSGIDLMVRDCPLDIGKEPDIICPEFYVSEDIWVRNNILPLSLEHQNPIGNKKNYVYVKVTNRGRNPSTGNGAEKLFLYWTKAGTNVYWSQSWDGTGYYEPDHILLGAPIGNHTIPQIQPGKDTVLEFEWWYAPDTADYLNLDGIEDCHHFCLLARIVAPDTDPMFTVETWNMGPNIQNNNNIAMKNVTIDSVIPKSMSLGSAIFVGNLSDAIKAYCLRFKLGANASTLHQEAEITVKLGDKVFEAWERGGGICQDVVVKEDNILLITGNNASLCNLIFYPHEIGRMSLTFNFLTRKKIMDNLEYDIHVVQTEGDGADEEIIGGEQYHVVTPPRVPFYAQADDIYAFVDDPITFHAADIGEPAVYRWYDADGNLVCEEQNFSTVANHETQYKLEVIALSDGYKDYATPKVKIVPGKIEEIFPNPTDNDITVVCVFNNVDAIPEAYIQVSDYMGMLYNEFQLKNSPATVSFSTQNYPIGTYVVRLFCNGQVADVKTFVRH